MDLVLSGANKLISTSWEIPKPPQAGQQPKGELKENNLGSSLGTVKPHCGQALCSLYKCSSLLIKTRTNPLAQSLASSTASKILLLLSGFKTIRSITISILCLLFFSSSFTSSIKSISPSILTRVKPFALILAIVSLKVPFSFLTIGERIWILLFSGLFIMISVIFWLEKATIGTLWVGQ